MSTPSNDSAAPPPHEQHHETFDVLAHDDKPHGGQQVSAGQDEPVLTETEGRLLAAAEDVARSLPVGPVHTVAAAALDAHGNVHTGVNVAHFTGGPCAELVVLGVAAAANAGPLTAMVAVGDGGRGVLAPCGRCRQVLLDLHPGILVVVPTGEGLVVKPIRDLLPFGYVASDG